MASRPAWRFPVFVPLSVLEFRDRAATYFGDKVGVIDGEQQFTYRAYAERTHRLANALNGLGIGAGDRVSFITYNTPVSYTHLRAHETPEHLVCRLLLEKT